MKQQQQQQQVIIARSTLLKGIMIGILGDVFNKLSSRLRWRYPPVSPQSIAELNEQKIEALVIHMLCLREDSKLMAVPEMPECIDDVLAALSSRDNAKINEVARRPLGGLPFISQVLRTEKKAHTEETVRLAYGLGEDVCIVAEGFNHNEVMLQLDALAQTKSPNIGLADRNDVENIIRKHHAFVDAVAQLARHGVLDETALFPEKGLARTHDDIKREIAECLRLRRAQWEEGLRTQAAKAGRELTKEERRDAFREFKREGAAALDRGEGSLARWRRERLEKMGM